MRHLSAWWQRRKAARRERLVEHHRKWMRREWASAFIHQRRGEWNQATECRARMQYHEARANELARG